MNNQGKMYYEAGLQFLEMEKYEQTILSWIQAYSLGYSKELILDNIYQCFIQPNDYEFRKNYHQNSREFTQLSYDECVMDFIPVSENKYYIFNREKSDFEGSIVLEKTLLQGQKLEFNSVLYTDTWDIRQVISDMEKQKYGMVYLLLGELEPKFSSFFKLPEFTNLYMDKIMLFRDTFSLRDFLLNHRYAYYPSQMVIGDVADVTEYMNLINEIKKEKKNRDNQISGRNILLLNGESQYGVLRRLINDVAYSLRKQGYNTLVLDLMQDSFFQQLCLAKEKFEFDAVVVCNAMGIECDAIRKCGKKYCTIMGDHPIWHDKRLEFADKDTIVLYGDMDNANYVKKYYPNVGRVEYTEPSYMTFLDDNIAYADRRFDVVFTGSYNDPNKIYEKICHMFDGTILMFVDHFIQKLIDYPNKTYEEALKETLVDYGQQDIEENQFNELAGEFYLVNQYIRSYFRDKVIREIVQNGIKIHVSGNGWEDFESEYRGNIIVESNDWYTAKKMIANAKISLNIMPWFKSGFNDRGVISLLSGSVLLTDTSRYINEHFVDMENIAIFELSKLETVSERIKFLLEHGDISAAIAERGRKIAQQEYLRDDVSKSLVSILQEELNEKNNSVKPGCDLSLIEEGTRRKSVALDVLEELKDIEGLLRILQSGNMFGIKDYQYCIDQLKEVTIRLASEFPGLEVGNYVWNIIANLDKNIPGYTTELIQMQISYLIRVINRECL